MTVMRLLLWTLAALCCASVASGQAAAETCLPAHNLAGIRKVDADNLIIKQDCNRLSWVYRNAAFNHEFTGEFVTPTEFAGVQSRTNIANGCTVQMEITGVARADRSFCVDARIVPGSQTCDLTKDFQQHNSCNDY